MLRASYAPDLWRIDRLFGSAVVEVGLQDKRLFWAIPTSHNECAPGTRKQQSSPVRRGEARVRFPGNVGLSEFRCLPVIYPASWGWTVLEARFGCVTINLPDASIGSWSTSRSRSLDPRSICGPSDDLVPMILVGVVELSDISTT